MIADAIRRKGDDINNVRYIDTITSFEHDNIHMNQLAEHQKHRRRIFRRIRNIVNSTWICTNQPEYRIQEYDDHYFNFDADVDPSELFEITNRIVLDQDSVIINKDEDDVPVYLNYAFRWICRNGYIDILNEFIDNSQLDNISNEDISFGFASACRNGYIAVVNRLLELTGNERPNIHVDAFQSACGNGHIAVVNRLLELTGHERPNVRAGDDYAFRIACHNGRIAVVNRLLELQGRERPDIHARDDYAFRMACGDGHIAVVNRLLQLTGRERPDIHARDDISFIRACVNGHTAIVNRLLELTGPERQTNLVRNLALIAACEFSQLEVIKILILNGADQGLIPNNIRQILNEDLYNFSTTIEILRRNLGVQNDILPEIMSYVDNYNTIKKYSYGRKKSKKKSKKYKKSPKKKRAKKRRSRKCLF
jgi:ankyrin repeat protein